MRVLSQMPQDAQAVRGEAGFEARQLSSGAHAHSHHPPNKPRLCFLWMNSLGVKVSGRVGCVHISLSCSLSSEKTPLPG